MKIKYALPVAFVTLHWWHSALAFASLQPVRIGCLTPAELSFLVLREDVVLERWRVHWLLSPLQLHCAFVSVPSLLAQVVPPMSWKQTLSFATLP